MSRKTRTEVLAKKRDRYARAGQEHKTKISKKETVTPLRRVLACAEVSAADESQRRLSQRDNCCQSRRKDMPGRLHATLNSSFGDAAQCKESHGSDAS